MSSKCIKGDWFLFVGLLALCLTVYFHLVISPQAVSPDAYFILPMLDRIGGLPGYISAMLELKTVDIQPIRDLSLLIDWVIFKRWGLNTFGLQNVLIWASCCFALFKVLKEIFPDLDELLMMALVAVFAVYPLFTGVVSWSIARKHMLAMLFTLLATYHFLLFLRNQKNKQIFWMAAFYFLGVFSQPICILWPFWAHCYVLFIHRSLLKEWARRSLPLMLIFVVGFIVNYLYYRTSPFFTFTFASKTSEAFDFSLKFYALGHYLYQLFSPYALAFPYSLDQKVSLIGGGFFIAFAVLYMALKCGAKEFIVWSIFSLFPLAIILNTPRLLLDPYLLLPSVGFLVLIIRMLRRLTPSRKWVLAISPFLIFWSMRSYQESKFWTDEELFASKNFKNAPICINAIRVARSHYNNRKRMPLDIRQFLFTNNCTQIESGYNELEHLVFFSQIIYFENFHSLENKIELLDKFATKLFYPRLVLAAILIDIGKEEEAIKEIQKVAASQQNLILDEAADPIIPISVHPFCEKKRLEGCLKITRQIRYKRNTPYF